MVSYICDLFVKTYACRNKSKRMQLFLSSIILHTEQLHKNFIYKLHYLLNLASNLLEFHLLPLFVSFCVKLSGMYESVLYTVCMSVQGDQGLKGELGPPGERGVGEPGPKVSPIITAALMTL